MGASLDHFEPAVNFDDALAKAATLCSIDLSYWDVFHKEHRLSREGLQSILKTLGWDVSTHEAVETERLRRYEEELRQPAKKTSVCNENHKSINLTLPSEANGRLQLTIELEDEKLIEKEVDISDLQMLVQGGSPALPVKLYKLTIPDQVPIGYHTLEINLNGLTVSTVNLVVCPEQAYLPENLSEGGKTAGFNVTLYGLRSERNWGCGDFTDLKALLEWAHSQVAFSFIGVNPLHALHNRVPYNASPYLPLSVYYKNHIYIDVEAVPEFAQSECAQALRKSVKINARIKAARDAEFVAYHEVDLLKNTFLKLLYREFMRSAPQARRKAFEQYCRQEGDLLDKFALYKTLNEVLHKQDDSRWTWLDWPSQYHDPDSSACQEFAVTYKRLIESFKYVQFVLEEQLIEAQTHAKKVGMSIGLYHDLAVATDSCGSELWAHGSFYVKGCRVGAPPDEFSPKGQDWSFPPPNARAHSDDGYRLYRESIRKIVRSGGALRLDHVMRLFRLFWIPAGMEPAQGTYVRDNAADLMSILALESVRSQNIIVGEDLGTVSDEIRDMLGRFRILSYRVFYFERTRETGFVPILKYPRQALVASATHDLATMTGFWHYRDIEARHAAGLLDGNAYREQTDGRKADKQLMLDILHAEKLIPIDTERNAEKITDIDGDLHNGIVGFLARVPCMLLLLNQEDLTKETEQQNLPGSTAEYPNWQRKMKIRIEDLYGPEMKPFTIMVRNQLSSAGRL